jgi:hypothetical protein
MCIIACRIIGTGANWEKQPQWRAARRQPAVEIHAISPARI